MFDLFNRHYAIDFISVVCMISVYVGFCAFYDYN